MCDSHLRILSLNTAFPGQNHDSYVWANSRIKEIIQGNYENGETLLVLGDSGYPQQP